MPRFAQPTTVSTLLTAALAAGLWISGVGSADAAVFGRDDRIRLPASAANLQSRIGTLTSAKSGALCSAFCVAPDIVATASHCIFGTAVTKSQDIKTLAFRRADAPLSAGTPIAGASTANQAQNVISGTQRLNVTPPIDADHDWAIVRLESAACASGALPLSETPAADFKRQIAPPKAYQVAVHRDLPDTDLRFASPCPIAGSFPQANADTLARDFSNPSGIMFHTCDTGAGSSGSPLLTEGPRGPEVIGINVGTYVLSRNIVSARAGDDTIASEPIANTAVATSQFAGALAALQARELLSTPKDVQELQRVLRDKGLYRGLVTGQSNDQLVAAVANFERLTNKPDTGLLRKSLLRELATWRSNQAGAICITEPPKVR